MPKIGKNIYKRKDGRWEGRYIKDRDASGKIIYGSVYGKTCGEVKLRLSSHSPIEPVQAAHPVTAANKSSLTFGEVAGQWLSLIIPRQTHEHIKAKYGIITLKNKG